MRWVPKQTNHHLTSIPFQSTIEKSLQPIFFFLVIVVDEKNVNGYCTNSVLDDFYFLINLVPVTAY